MERICATILGHRKGLQFWQWQLCISWTPKMLRMDPGKSLIGLDVTARQRLLFGQAMQVTERGRHHALPEKPFHRWPKFITGQWRLLTQSSLCGVFQNLYLCMWARFVIGQKTSMTCICGRQTLGKIRQGVEFAYLKPSGDWRDCFISAFTEDSSSVTKHLCQVAHKQL